MSQVMKRTILLLTAALLSAGMTYAQLNKAEAKALGNFLSQTSADGQTNAAALGVGVNNIAAAPGIKVENGRIVEIDWRGKKLAGSLNLSNFPALQKVNVSDNKLTSLTLANNPALVGVNAAHNLSLIHISEPTRR